MNEVFGERVLAATPVEVRRWLDTEIPAEVKLKGTKGRLLHLLVGALFMVGTYAIFQKLLAGEHLDVRYLPDHPVADWSFFIIALTVSLAVLGLSIAEYVRPARFQLRLSEAGIQYPFFFWPVTQAWHECGPFALETFGFNRFVKSKLVSRPNRAIILPPKKYGLKGKELVALLNRFRGRAIEQTRNG